MKATFEKTVDILVKAYLNDTLEHGVCSACAVGNICLAAGAKYSPPGAISPGDNSAWKWVLYTQNIDGEDFTQILQPKNTDQYNEGLKVIEATGYTVEQLAKIEWAFETANQGQSTDEYMFNGLMKVVNILADIHGISLEAKEEAKKMFVKI